MFFGPNSFSFSLNGAARYQRMRASDGKQDLISSNEVTLGANDTAQRFQRWVCWGPSLKCWFVVDKIIWHVQNVAFVQLLWICFVQRGWDCSNQFKTYFSKQRMCDWKLPQTYQPVNLWLAHGACLLLYYLKMSWNFCKWLIWYDYELISPNVCWLLNLSWAAPAQDPLVAHGSQRGVPKDPQSKKRLGWPAHLQSAWAEHERRWARLRREA